MSFLNLPSVRGADEPVSGSSLGRILRRAWAVFEDTDDGHVKLKKPDDSVIDLEAGGGFTEAEGEGPPTLALDNGVNSIYVLGLFPGAEVGELVLAVDDGENPLVEVTLSALVMDQLGTQGAAVFAAEGVTVSFALWSGGEFDGYPSCEFTGAYGEKAIALTVVSNTIADLDPADPVEVQAGSSPTPNNPPDPTAGEHYLDTLTGLTWTYNGVSWTPPIGAVLDYVEVTSNIVFTDADDSVIITANPITLDGDTAVVVEFCSFEVEVNDVGGECRYTFHLYDGDDVMYAVAGGIFGPGADLGVTPIYVRSPTFTPVAGEHVFSVKAIGGAGGGGGVVSAGTGAGDAPPIYLRVTRA